MSSKITAFVLSLKRRKRDTECSIENGKEVDRIEKDTDCNVLCGIVEGCVGTVHHANNEKCHHFTDMNTINKVKGYNS